MSRLIRMSAAHGNLKQSSSSAFVMTTAGPLPEVLRMEDLGGALQELGVPVKETPPARETARARGSTAEPAQLPTPPAPGSVIE